MGQGARVGIDELDSPNGSHLAYRPHDRIIFPLPGIVSRLSAIALFRSLCRRRCRQALAFEIVFSSAPFSSLPRWAPPWRCLVGRQLTCVVNTHRPVSPRSWHFVLRLPSSAPSRPARASRSPIGSDARRFDPPDYILGALVVIYPVAGITAMIALDDAGALFASLCPRRSR